MKDWLFLAIVTLVCSGCSSQNVCEEPEYIDFGEIVSTEKAKYLENDQVQYRCNPGYVLEGAEWIQCKAQEWTPRPPKCLAPCSITRQQLAAKNLFVFGSQRKARLIQSNQSLQFWCNEGYVLVVPSVRKCVDGYMDLPLCISERGKNCSDPPRIENGDIIPLSEEQYRSGSSVEFRCQKYYTMEGQNRSFCDNGTWTKVPICLEITCNSPRILNGSFQPQRTTYHDGDLIQIQCHSGFTFEPNNGERVVECTKNGWSPSPKCVRKGCDYIHIENGRMSDYYEKYKPFPRQEGQRIDFRCNHGFLPPNKAAWQRATCLSSHYDPEPKCIKRCDPSLRFYNGHFTNTNGNTYIEGDRIAFVCDKGYSPANQQSTSTCTKSGWSPAPRCVPPVIEGGCGRPPAVDNGDIIDTLKEIYVDSEDVTYQCQYLYIMEGSARVTCQNGRWSQTPKCRVPCTANCIPS
ncbi:complement factor H-related protein 1-like [Crotalus adamanteus]|uniref:Complement factor H-related protein 1-like n=1 Tax=Crotalus adamanteus TaxID=8729 RepID=A0AAW1BQ59_CROAD